jgi:histidine triad (HIT) family protein
MPSIFTRIILREIPCHEVYRDENVIAFLDIAPLSVGHVLIVPVEEREFLHELSDESAAAIGRALPRVARAVIAATGATAYNVLQNNGATAHQAVPHVHFHIIPKYGEGSGVGCGLGVDWNAGQLASADATKLVAKIREHIKI